MATTSSRNFRESLCYNDCRFAGAVSRPVSGRLWLHLGSISVKI